MNYYFYLALFKDKPGDDIIIRISVNSLVKNYFFNQIEELPEKELSQYGESIKINANSFRISRKILTSFNEWGLCFPNFRNKQGSILIMISPSSARLFMNCSDDNLKKNYDHDITVRYIEGQKT